jgi:hypothetical protein
MNASISHRLGLLVAVLLGLAGASSALAAAVPILPHPTPVRPPPEDPGLPDIRLEKRITATLADEGKGSILRIPKAWLEATTSTSRPADAAPTTHADARRSAAVQTTLAGLLAGALLMVMSWQFLRRRPVNSTLLSVAGAAIILLLAGAAQADLAAGPAQDSSQLQVGPNQTSGPITLETSDTGDEAQLTLSRDIVHTLFAKSGPR